ncbi:hypothetical protein P170DRAFT_506937 [Aspergillus steynii IBT 23096]|uniref:Uncharacterized protein n=1 Tax=Aspergillus steynii IBT 23096 TaxID=1392250 RepID=A0A2I2GGN3_9EURO|nr:uncharacterized protein P170DRAFT_506937 [Aspergillus steynii IBT 23096]PLB52042.1 hypothetical protein P170DRAFT_506937 [Aspergillus steynii IBT 23096]
MDLAANPLPFAPITSTEVCYVSASYPSYSGEQTRSRSRRSNRSSSDEDPVTAWDGFIEEDFRAGGLNLCEGPCETIHKIPKSHPYYDILAGSDRFDLELELFRLAREINPEITEIHFCGRRSLLEVNQDPSLTVLFYGQRHLDTTRGWIDIARKVRHRLHQRGLEMQVEILDIRFCQRVMPFPCYPSDAIFPIWADVVDRILSTLDVSGIYTIGCYRIGSDDRQKSSPTILVGMDRKPNHNWKIFREDLVGILDHFGLSTVAILLRKETSILRNGDDDVPAFTYTPVAAKSTREVNLGCSLCPSQQIQGGGTFSGWIELQNPDNGAWEPFGITCTHCVLPDDKVLSETQRPVEEWRRNGVPFADAKAAEILLMDSPSRSEIKRGTGFLTGLEEHYTKSPTYQRVQKAKREDDLVLPYEEKAWKESQTQLKAYRDEKEALEQFIKKGYLYLGHVMVASGLQERPKKLESLPSIVDWAFIRPLDRSVGTNDELLANEELSKIGSVAGLTRGSYNGLKTAIIRTKIINGQEDNVTAWAHTITSGSLETGVAKAGDSGFLIFDALNGVVGMCFGGAYAGDILYFTHTSDLIESIREVSGATQVRLRV